MALAVWDITTITSGTTLYGSTSRWLTYPDAFPPAGYMMTTTPTIATSAYGLYIEYNGYCTTSIGPGGTGSFCRHIQPIKVRSYIKGTRSFILDGEIDNTTLQRASEGIALAPKKLILYYRSVSEYGDTPS